MEAASLGYVVRRIRIHNGLTQSELALRVGVDRRTIASLESERASTLPFRKVETILRGLGARLDVRVLWHGPQLDRMLDAGHAALSALVKARLERIGWIVRVEVSYSRYGERGRIDLLAWHLASRLLLVIEIKTEFVDVNSLLGALDAKARLAASVVRENSWGWEVSGVIPAIVFAEDSTTRGRLARVDTLFDRYDLRGRAALGWLRRPTAGPNGLLWFVNAPAVKSRSDRPRVRHPKERPRT